VSDYEKLLLERAKRAFNQQPIAAYTNRIRAIIGPPAGELQGLAKEAMDALGNGEVPTPKQLAALELVIRLMRPAPLCKEGRPDDLDTEVAPSFPLWDSFRTALRPFLYSIGRVDRLPRDGIGTGFLITPDLLATNKHVLDALTNGTHVLEKGQGVVRFKYEYGSPDEAPVAIVGVAKVHPTLDMALLQLEQTNFSDGRLPLRASPVEVEPGHPVVAVGYPFNDPGRNPLFIGPIFGDRFGVKRAAPGEVTGRAPQSIYHDCSTLGGNSGSPILSMQSAHVVGVHREGMFMYRNEAVDGKALSEFIA
jgi:S1-C subfamily serine protease